MDYQSFQPGGQEQPVSSPPIPEITKSQNLSERLRPYQWHIAVVGGIIIVLLFGAYSYLKYTNQKLSQEVVPTFTPRADETADWKTYTNTQYGFEFKYPNNINGNTTGDEFTGSVDGNSVNIDVKVINTKDARFLGKNFQVIEGTKTNNQTVEYMYVSLDKFPGKEIEFFAEFPYVDLRQIVPTFKFIDSAGTSTWKTYANTQYGFEFKYPLDYSYHATENDRIDFVQNDDIGEIKSFILTIEQTKYSDVSVWFDSIYLGRKDLGLEIPLKKYLIVDSNDALLYDIPRDLIPNPIYKDVVFKKDLNLYKLSFKSLEEDQIRQILSTFKFTR